LTKNRADRPRADSGTGSATGAAAGSAMRRRPGPKGHCWTPRPRRGDHTPHGSIIAQSRLCGKQHRRWQRMRRRAEPRANCADCARRGRLGCGCGGELPVVAAGQGRRDAL